MGRDTGQRGRQAFQFCIYVEQVIKRLHRCATVRFVKGELKPNHGQLARSHQSQSGSQRLHAVDDIRIDRSIDRKEHTSELQSLMRNSYAVFCLKKKKKSQLDT